jgi:hypothetical protein
MFHLELSLKLIPPAPRFEKLLVISASAVLRLMLWCNLHDRTTSAGVCGRWYCCFTLKLTSWAVALMGEDVMADVLSFFGVACSAETVIYPATLVVIVTLGNSPLFQDKSNVIHLEKNI